MSNLSKEQMQQLNARYYIVFVIGAAVAVGGMFLMRSLVGFIAISTVGIIISIIAFTKGRKLEKEINKL